MFEVVEETNSYLSDFAKFEKSLPEEGGNRISHIRKAAIAHFAQLRFPTTRNEEWKYTSVSPIAKTPFQQARYELDGITDETIRHASFGQLECNRLVYVNGHFSPELSSIRPLQGGVRLANLATPLDEIPNGAEAHLARYASCETHAFTALNTAFMKDVAFLYVPKGTVVREPILLLFLSIQKERPTMAHPRSLIVVGKGSQVTVVESHLGQGKGVYFTNAVTEIVSDENSIIEHYKVQREGDEAFHIATLQAQLGRSSNFVSHSISMGGALVRNDLNAVLDGEGIECTLNGLYLATGQQLVDNHTSIDHARPHCSSRELYKGILDQKSTGVFNGKIIVRKDAQKTNALQTNKNLLLSSESEINTKPQLEISADDVKCTHGATIGQLDEDAMFYMRSRGLDPAAARSLLIYAFASEILGRMKIEPIRSQLDCTLLTRLPKDQRIKETV